MKSSDWGRGEKAIIEGETTTLQTDPARNYRIFLIVDAIQPPHGGVESVRRVVFTATLSHDIRIREDIILAIHSNRSSHSLNTPDCLAFSDARSAISLPRAATAWCSSARSENSIKP